MRTIIRAGAVLAVTALTVVGLSGCGSSTPTTSASGAGTGKTYIIASDNSFAPFEYLDPTTNSYVGVDMDLMAAIAKDQGFSYKMNNVGFDAAMGAVQSGQADGMISGMNITPERQQTFDFSTGYFQDGQVMVVAQGSPITSISDLQGKTVAIKASTQGATYAQSVASQYGFTTQTYKDSPTMYTAVANGQNAACFEDYAVIAYAIKQGTVKLQTVGDQVQVGQYGFAVKKGTNADLMTMFNKGLADLQANGQYDQILSKYGLTNAASATPSA